MNRRDDNRTAMQGGSLGADAILDRGTGRRDKLGEVARVSDFKPVAFEGVAADSRVGRSPATSSSGHKPIWAERRRTEVECNRAMANRGG